MELPRTTGIDLPPPGESELLGRLLSLYEEEARVYTRVLELSQRQGEAVRQGAPFSEIRRLLEQKRGCLDLIARLERGEVGSKREWESRRAAMSRRSQPATPGSCVARGAMASTLHPGAVTA